MYDENDIRPKALKRWLIVCAGADYWIKSFIKFKTTQYHYKLTPRYINNYIIEVNNV